MPLVLIHAPQTSVRAAIHRQAHRSGWWHISYTHHELSSAHERHDFWCQHCLRFRRHVPEVFDVPIAPSHAPWRCESCSSLLWSSDHPAHIEFVYKSRNVVAVTTSLAEMTRFLKTQHLPAYASALRRQTIRHQKTQTI